MVSFACIFSTTNLAVSLYHPLKCNCNMETKKKDILEWKNQLRRKECTLREIQINQVLSKIQDALLQLSTLVRCFV